MPLLYIFMAGIKDAAIGTTTVERFYTFSEIPHLTTTFTYPDSCREQWLQPWPDIETSTFRSNFYSAAYYGNYFTECQPEKNTKFSPGICPSGHHIASILEYDTGEGEDKKLWRAYCCSK
jgi:hypothetical protein